MMNGVVDKESWSDKEAGCGCALIIFSTRQGVFYIQNRDALNTCIHQAWAALDTPSILLVCHQYWSYVKGIDGA